MNETAKLIAGSLLALGLAWLWDRLFIVSGVSQRLRVGLLVPMGEEVIKLGIFNSLHLSPPLFYGLFGMGEGLLESIILPRRFKFALILAGFITHIIFSLFFLTAFPRYFQLILAISAHCLWNLKVLQLKRQKY